MKNRITIIAAALCCTAALGAAADEHREISGIRMPETARVGGKELTLNGMGLHTKLLFKAYVAGLYLQSPTRQAREALAADEPKRVVMVVLRDVSRDNVVKEVERNIERTSGRLAPGLRQRLDGLEQTIPELKEGEVLTFTYLPGNGTLMEGAGRKTTVRGKDFADVLFSVWLGPKADHDLKRALLGG